jgi:O-methyltransferase involved in polyketide biosynthesis
MQAEERNFSSVSPSAKSLLLMKGYTSIPYAREAAALMKGPEVFGLSFDETDFWFWIRVMHFESRYRSIDELLTHTNATNILELSSGYSFRGPDFCARNERLHYIDTDLPEVVAVKQRMIDELQLAQNIKGRYELLPLNAMDEAAFNKIVERFGDGPLTIVNEGLLMYLDREEKKRLCQTIHSVLKRRGGCWITADIYIRRSAEMQAALPQSFGESAFMQQHHVEDNKFDSYEAAENFLRGQGFDKVMEAPPNYQELSVMPHLLKVLPEELRASKEPPPKIQATWMLKAV